MDGRLAQLERTADAIVSDSHRTGSTRRSSGTSVAAEARLVARVAIYSYLSEENPVFLRPIAESRSGHRGGSDCAACCRTPQDRDRHRRARQSQFAEVAVPFDEPYILRLSAAR